MSSLVNHSVTNLINGVSQQATSVRLDNQLEEQINAFADVTKGLTIRNGLELKNVVAQDISNRYKIEFDVDGQKYILGLDPEDVTPLIHIPLTADIAALTASVTDIEYFKNTLSTDIKVIEDKDKVYILNKKKTVGLSTLKSTFFDVNIQNQRTGNTDTDWSSGTYKLTITSVADPDTGAVVAETPVEITVDNTMSPQDVVAAFNATSMVNETGTIEAIGDKGAYRIFFEDIPLNFQAPTIAITELTALENSYSETIFEPSTGFNTTTSSVPASVSEFRNAAGNYEYFIIWDGVQVLTTVSPSKRTTFVSGGYTYSVGNLIAVDDLTSLGGGIIYVYSVRRESLFSIDDSYDALISQPTVVTGAEFSADKFADEGMIWVTGVQSNQTYDVTIEYEDAAGVAQTPITLSTISVGTTVSNIKLNYVAEQIRSQIDASTHFTAGSSDIYNNAVHFYATTPYAHKVTKIIVDNNYDTSSISSAIKASTDNESGVTDISDLPPVFADGFKVRVGDSDVVGSNYYLNYVEEFSGWKECGLDESRIIDVATMPYVIDKEKVRRDQVITIEQANWESSQAGDAESNPDPSFIGRTINDMFFYGSRLGFATDDTLVMSAIDKTQTFFRTTTSKVVSNDRKDIKLDTSKIGYDAINSVVTYDGKLLVNTGTTQSVLLINTSFDLATARLSEVSSYTLGTFKPLPVDDGLYFALSIKGRTNIYNYLSTGNNTYKADNITRHIPTYIEGNVREMAYADNFAVIGVDDKKKLYVQNRYTSGQEVLQNAWHRWELPYDVEYFYFEDNSLFLLLSAENDSAVVKTFVCEFDLTPQIVEESQDNAYIGWTPYLDCYTKDKTLIEDYSAFIGINDNYGTVYEDVATAYASTEVEQVDQGAIDGPYYDQSSPVFYWKVEGNLNTIVWDDGTAINLGNTEITQFDYLGFRYFRGDESVDSGYYEISRAPITPQTFYKNDIVYGVPFTTTIELSEIIPRIAGQDGFTVMNYATLMLRRMRLYLGNTGVFDVSIDFLDRKDYSLVYTGKPLGQILLGRNSVSDINFKFPINGKSDKVKITISTDSSTPFNLLSAEWQGKLTVKGRNI